MKLLVIGIDAMMPDILFENLEQYPTIKKLVESGVSGSYDGYVYGHASHDNWTSMYTGLPPKEHQIIKGIYVPKNRLPRLYDYSHHETIWKVLNNNGYRVGMWKGLVTSPPEPIEGYMISGELAFDKYFEDPEIALDGNMLVEKDKHLEGLFTGDFPKRPDPKGPEYFGYSWEEIFENPKLIERFLDENYYEECLEYLKKMLDYSIINLKKVNEKEPVDLLWFYNGIFDLLGHFTFHDKERTLIKKAFKYIDSFVAKMLEICKPENVVFFSDHGQKSYIDLFPNCSIELQKESFGLADQCAFTGDNIVMKSRTGGFMSSLHSLKGTMVLCGEEFKHGELKNVCNLDIYPMILELFECKVPENRIGLVPDVFKKKNYVNTHVNDIKPKENKKVLLIQNTEVGTFNGYINEYYKENRFTDIYVLGPEKYRDVFIVNDQVKEFIAFEDEYLKDEFDEVLVTYDNKKSNELIFLNIK